MTEQNQTTPLTFHPIRPQDTEGLLWRDQEREHPFARVPLSLRHLSHIHGNAMTTTGECCHFTTDSSRIAVRLELGEEKLQEVIFGRFAYSGVDLYIFDDDETHRWRWAGTFTDYYAIKDQHPEYLVIEGLPRRPRRCRLYYPMRNRMTALSVGVEPDASFELIPPRTDNLLVYYGTSIIHGAYSLRAGLGIAQLLARHLDLPLANLGFSGACRLDPEMAALLAQLHETRLLVIDPFHNVNPPLIRERLAAFLDVVCPALPQAQVAVVTSPSHLQSWLKPALAAQQNELHTLMRDITTERMTRYPNLHFIDGHSLYGTDEVSPDGVHPNDTAAWNMALTLATTIRPWLAP